ncbi:MAG TPA: hypothetical protein PK587_04745 [Syntrophales bacterium]|nr:hypothetical protein [Syntrophales bacterium]
MGTINLDDIKPGMVLEKEVQGRDGRVLLGAGQAISDKHLRIFKMWGVTEASIMGVQREEIAAQTASRLDPASLRKAEHDLRTRFRNTDLSHPFLSEFFRILSLKLARGGRTADGE